MAPEVALNQPYNEKVDMYSYAIILYEIITGCAPFSGLKKDEFYVQVVNNKSRPEFDYDDYGRAVTLRPQVQAIITQCWDPVSTNRLSSEQVYDIIREEEAKALKKVNGQGFLRKTANSLFGRKDTI